MEIANPRHLAYAAAALVLLPCLYLLARRARGRALSRLVEAHQARRLAAVEGRGTFLVRLVLAGLGVALAFVALSRPRWGTRLEVVNRKGVDVIVALDTSLSMLTEDVAPNRLAMAKRTVSDLIDRLGGDRIGIVAFAGDAYVACPLTLDTGAARMFLADVGPGSVGEPGTAVGTAIRKAVKAFGRKEQKYKALILLTDGEDHRTDPMGAAEEAREAGVVIFALGFGTGSGAPIPIKEEEGAISEYKKNQKGEVVVSRLDEATLAAVAAHTGGVYLRATPSQRELDTLFGALEKMEKTDLSQRLHALKQERFQIPLLAGLVLLLMEGGLRALSRRRSPPLARLLPLAFAALLAAVPASAGPLPFTGAAVDVAEGNELYGQGKHDEALSAYARARAHAPDAPEIPYDVGNVLYQQKKYDEALREYGKAAGSSDAPMAARALYNQGNAHFRAGRLPEAMKAFSEAMRRDPRDRDAKWNYELARRRLEEQKQEQQKQDQQQKEDDKDQKDQKDQKSQGGKAQEKDSKDEGKQDPGEEGDSKERPNGEEQQKRPSPEPKQGEESQPQVAGADESGGPEKKPQAGAEPGDPGQAGAAATGELTKEQAEKLLDAFVALEKEAKQRAERKKMKALRGGGAEDW